MLTDSQFMLEATTQNRISTEASEKQRLIDENIRYAQMTDEESQETIAAEDEAERQHRLRIRAEENEAEAIRLREHSEMVRAREKEEQAAALLLAEQTAVNVAHSICVAKLTAAEKRSAYSKIQCVSSPARVQELSDGNARYMTIEAQKRATKAWCKAASCRSAQVEVLEAACSSTERAEFDSGQLEAATTKATCQKYEDDARKENAYTSTAFYGQKGCGAHNDKCMEKQACFSAIQALAQ